MHVCICMYMHICVCLCVRVCICIQIYTLFLDPFVSSLSHSPSLALSLSRCLSSRFVSTLNAYVVFGGGFIFRPLGGVVLVSLSHTHTQTLYLSLSHTHTLSLTHSLLLSPSISLSLILFLPHSIIFSLSFSFTHSPTFFLSLAVSLFISVPLTHILPLPIFLSLSLSPSLSQAHIREVYSRKAALLIIVVGIISHSV